MSRFRLVGVPQGLGHEGASHALERRDAALLAVLLLKGPQPRAALAALLWPRTTPERARNSLRQRLHRLRRSVEGSELVIDRGALQLLPGLVEPLEQALDRLRSDPAGAPLGLLDGLAYDEPELADWIAAQRAHWADRVLDALGALIDEHERLGGPRLALPYARRLVAEDPAREVSQLRLVGLLHAAGEGVAALNAFSDAARLLRLAHGAGPGPEWLALRSRLDEPASAPRVDQALPAALLRPPRLVGRDAECARIGQALARGRVAVVEGQAGVGKSRLLEAVSSARSWPPPVAARQGDAGLPYALLARWLDAMSRHFGPLEPDLARDLGQLVPRLARPDAAEGAGPLSPTRLLRAVELALDGWLEAWRTRAAAASASPEPELGAGAETPSAARPVGSAIDDLQFADAASLELMLNLAADTRLARLEWLLALREDAWPPALGHWRDRLDARRVERVRLQPLDVDGTVELLASLQLPGLDARRWAGALLEQVGGHPFDLLDALVELHGRGQRDFSGPPSLGAPAAGHRREAVLRRLARLDPPALELVQVAAVAGPEFDAELAARVLGRSPAALVPAWRSLERAGVFAGEGFAHALLQQTAQEELPQPLARALHRRVATALAADPGATPPARMAWHWEGARQWAQAAAAYEAAAGEAQARSAGREELLALDGAMRAHRAAAFGDSPAHAFACEVRRVRLLLLLDSADLALAAADALLARAEGPAQRVEALEARAFVRGERLELEAALDDAQAALALALPPEVPARLRLIASQRAAAVLLRLGRPAEAATLLEAPPEDVEGLPDHERLMWLSERASALDYADRRREAIAAFARTIDEAERLGRWAAAAEAWGNKAVALMYLNRLQASEEASRRAIASGQRAGLEQGALLIDEMNLAGSLRDLGRFAEYLPLAESLPRRLRAAGYAAWALNAENDLAIAYAWLGRPELAHRTLSPVPPDAPALLGVARLFTESRLLRRSDARAAADRVRQARALLVGGEGIGRGYVGLKLALEVARDLPLGAARAEAQAIEVEAERREQFMLAAHAQLLRLELSRREPEAETAELVPLVEALVARCEADGLPPGLYAPEVWWTAAGAVQALDPARGAELLLRARAWILEHAMPQLPEVFHRSFLERNPVNAAVLRATRDTA